VTEIRSYRRVFDLERRVYRVDRLRLNPGGVPVRGLVYFAAALLVCLLAARAPLLGSLAAMVPWYVRDVATPLAAATVLGVVRIEGRTFHVAAWSLLRQLLGPRVLAGADARALAPARWNPGALTVLADGGSGELRRLLYTGPGAVRVRARQQVIALAPGARLRVGGRGSGL
jgi:hypothetical protein